MLVLLSLSWWFSISYSTLPCSILHPVILILPASPPATLMTSLPLFLSPFLSSTSSYSPLLTVCFAPKHKTLLHSLNPFSPPPLLLSYFTSTGIDAGGLTREWYLVLSREIFNCNYALFTAAADGATFQPNPLSMINMNHLDYFKFVGRVIGKAICDGQLMDAHFTRSVPCVV